MIGHTRKVPVVEAHSPKLRHHVIGCQSVPQDVCNIHVLAQLKAAGMGVCPAPYAP
jgi:hypothetical protein